MNQDFNSIFQQSSDVKQHDIFEHDTFQNIAKSQENDESAIFKEPVKFDDKYWFGVSGYFSKIDRILQAKKLAQIMSMCSNLVKLLKFIWLFLLRNNKILFSKIYLYINCYMLIM